MIEPRYYIHTFQHRDERRVWYVADRQSRRVKWVSKAYFSEKSCRNLCDRMNAEWQKYLTHRIAEHATATGNK